MHNKYKEFLSNAQLIPIPQGRKAPAIKGWQNKSFSEADFAEADNIGLRFDEHYFAIDIDTAEAEQAWKLMLELAMYEEEAEKHISWTSDKASYKKQVLFRRPANFVFANRRDKNGLELRTGKTQSVLPPSIHPDTGRPYRWIVSPWDKQAICDEPPPELIHELASYFAEDKHFSAKRYVTSAQSSVLEAWVWCEAQTVLKQIRAFEGTAFDGTHQHRSDFLKAKASRLFRYSEYSQAYEAEFEQAVLDNSYFEPKHHAQIKSLIAWTYKSLLADEAPHYSHVASKVVELAKQIPTLKEKALEQLKAMWYECDKSEFVMQMARSLC